MSENLGKQCLHASAVWYIEHLIYEIWYLPKEIYKQNIEGLSLCVKCLWESLTKLKTEFYILSLLLEFKYENILLNQTCL